MAREVIHMVQFRSWSVLSPFQLKFPMFCLFVGLMYCLILLSKCCSVQTDLDIIKELSANIIVPVVNMSE